MDRSNHECKLLKKPHNERITDRNFVDEPVVVKRGHGLSTYFLRRILKHADVSGKAII